MGDFRRLVELQLEEFRDAIVAQHAQELDALREEIRRLRQAFAGQQMVAQDADREGQRVVVSSEQESCIPEGTLDHSPHRSALVSINLAADAPPQFEEAPKCNMYERVSTPPANNLQLSELSEAVDKSIRRRKGRTERYIVRDFWISKYHLLQGVEGLVTHRSRYDATPKRSIDRAFAASFSRILHGKGIEPQTFIVDPDSKICTVWGWTSVLLLLYDLFFIPVDVAFYVPEETWSVAMTWLGRVFWSLDLLMSFITGVYISGEKEMKFKSIVYWYSRTWLPFDLTIVGADWTMYFVGEDSAQRSFTILRSIRFVRLMRLLRLGKLRKTASDMAHRFSSELPTCVSALAEVIFVSSYLAMVMHLLSCVWYVIARSTGVTWERASSSPNTVVYNYLSSMHLTLTLQHELSDSHAHSIAERALACATVFVSLLVYSLVVARLTYAVFAVKDSTTAKLVAISWRFKRNRMLSRTLIGRVHQYLRAQQAEGIGDQIVNERMLMASLPETLQVDINSEIRAPVLTLAQLFLDMQAYNPRALRKICHVAMSELLVLDRDAVFAPGDGCFRMLFVSQGSFIYLPGKRESIYLGESSRPMSPIKSLKSSNPDQATLLEKDMYLCEPALWTSWEHKGDLIADKDSLMVELSADKFEEAIRHNHSASIHALMYARHFVWSLNHGKVRTDSDVINLSFPMDTLEKELFTGSEDEHFIFVSHYKRESGTEAAMMTVDLERMIREDPDNAASEFRFPVFVDSENLRDLSTLTVHVRKSRYLLFLLTPAVLSRPWCLLELVHATRQGVEVLPVLIQRPGFAFEFPTETHYDRILAASVYDQETLDFLSAEGVELPELVDCMRTLFRKIALSFSPHRSVNIRQAELAEILGACAPIPWDDCVACV